MKLKIINVFLCLVLLLNLSSVQAYAATSTSPLTMADAIAVEGADPLTVDVPIAVDFTDALGIDLNIRLNPNLVATAELVNPSESISGTMYTANQTVDKFKVAIATGFEISNSGTLFYLRLKLKKQPASTDELCRLLQIKINDRITWQATDRVLLTGVTDGAIYQNDVTVTFNEGTATLNGEPFVSGGTVTSDGEFTLTVTDSGGAVRTVRFTIDRTVISVNIEWTDMSFSYSEGVWNCEKHIYENRGWSVTEGGGDLTVTNNSNVAVSSEFSYEANEGFEDISVDFMKGNEAIETYDIEIGESVTVSVSPKGEPKEHFDNREMGTITVKIQKLEEVTTENE